MNNSYKLKECLYKMTDERKKELEERYILSDNNGEINQLDIQEIIYLYFLIVQKNKGNDNITKKEKSKKQFIFSSIIIKLITLDEFYVAYSAVTRNPHIDPDGHAWIFSKEEFAKEALEHYMQRMIMITIKKIKKEDMIQQFVEFYRLGIKTILIDNGHYNTVIQRRDIINEDEIAKNPITDNSELSFYITSFLQNIFTNNSFDGKEKLLGELEANMIKAVSEATFLVPVKMKNRKMLKDNEVTKIDSPEAVQLAVLTAEKDNTNWLPAFTDWIEFIKKYSKDEWNASLMSYTQLMDAAASCDGIVVNPGGAPLEINKENQKRIKDVITE